MNFVSPARSIPDRSRDLFRALLAEQQIDRKFDFIHFAPVGDQVFVTYEARASSRRFRNTELLTIKDGRMAYVEVYFGWSIPHEAPVGEFVTAKSG